MVDSKLDAQMKDWREKFYGQHSPHRLHKLNQNIGEFKKLLNEEDSLLDVGCNVGAIYHSLNHKNYEGIDLDPEAIASASAEFPEAKWRVCDLFDLEGQWDVVLASRVLMHIAPFEGAMKKLLGAARKKCVLFVPIADLDYVDVENLYGCQTYFRRFSEESFKALGDCVIHRTTPYSTVIYG